MLGFWQKIAMLLRFIAIISGLTISTIFSIFAEVELTQSQVPQLSNSKSPAKKLEIVKKRADLIRFNGQKVKLIGRYTSKAWKPDPRFTGIPDFQGMYIKSQIVLEDGTLVSVFPSWNKQSLRSPDEAEDYNQKNVTAIGVVKFAAKPYPTAPTSESFINLVQLRLHHQESKLYYPHSVVQEFEQLSHHPSGISLNAWQFIRQSDIDTDAKPQLWGIAREYELKMTNSQEDQPNLPIHTFKLMLGRNLPAPEQPLRRPLPNGEQFAFTEGGIPNHVAALRLSYETTPENLKTTANWLQTFQPTLLTLAQNCFDADESDISFIEQQIAQTLKDSQTNGAEQNHRYQTSRIGLDVNADVPRQHLSALLWRKDQPGERKGYCDLEPRNVKFPS
ncbi:hypothetical protein ACQFX9_17915 [Aliinostoc sp. HNIBRCY26]|uniref:hypothetical protein n=1 Tax=Aliinostoc sp. HNIBRCY26 TaxID=3418997 RepID=UPI003CFE6526